jgi:hypothetical protein
MGMRNESEKIIIKNSCRPEKNENSFNFRSKVEGCMMTLLFMRREN